MKKLLKSLTLIGLAMGFLFPVISSAQKTINLTEAFEIQLASGADIQQTYQVDISQLNFKRELSAERFFGAISDNLASFEVNFKEKQVRLQLRTDAFSEPWSAADWNEYFQEKKKPLPEVLSGHA